MGKGLVCISGGVRSDGSNPGHKSRAGTPLFSLNQKRRRRIGQEGPRREKWREKGVGKVTEYRKRSRQRKGRGKEDNINTS